MKQSVRYYFSEKNERALDIAHAIAPAQERARIAYSLPEKRRFSHTSLYFFVGDDGEDNLKKVCCYLSEKHPDIRDYYFVWATGLMAEMIVRGYQEKGYQIRLVDERYLGALDFLKVVWPKLLSELPPIPWESVPVNVLLAGADETGWELFRMLLWISQIDGYRINLYLLDEAEEKKEHIKETYPELLYKKVNGKYIVGEARYHIKFLSSLEQIPTLTAAFVSDATDGGCIVRALEVRQAIETAGDWAPVFAFIKNAAFRLALPLDERDESGRTHGVQYVGGPDWQISGTSLCLTDLETAALQVSGQPDVGLFGWEESYRVQMTEAVFAEVLREFPKADREQSLQRMEKMILRLEGKTF